MNRRFSADVHLTTTKPPPMKLLVFLAMVGLLAHTAGCPEQTSPHPPSPHLSRPAPATCPFSGAIELPGIPAEAGLGPGTDDVERLIEGPVYTVFQAIPRRLDLFPPTRDGWRSATILVVSRPSYRGPVLVRGRQLDGPSSVGFGAVSQKERDLRLPAGPWDERRRRLRVWGRRVHPRKDWRVAVSQILMREGGCFGLQVVGTSFSYPIRFTPSGSIEELLAPFRLGRVS
jgi:hypothetical protein